MAVIGSTAWRQEQNAKKNNTIGGVTNSAQTTDNSVSSAAGETVSTPSSPSTPSGGYQTYAKGQNTALDNSLKQYSDAYSTARASGDWQGMQSANEKANQLRNQYGYAAQSAYDDVSTIRGQNGGGTDFSMGGVRNTAQQGTQIAPGVNDYSQYIEEMNQASKESALAELRSAYQKNIAGLNRTEQNISPTYTAARNQAAVSAELAKRQFNEYAAANGLNSGAGGQAQLAMNNTLQTNLSNLNTQEASSLADLDLQRSQTEIDYNNAIAKAKSDGNYTLAQQLYSEKVRADEALRSQMQWQAQQDYNNAQLKWEQEQAGLSNQKDDTSNLYQMAMQYAQSTGDYSLLGQFGFTSDQISQMQTQWQKDQGYQDQLNALTLQSQYSKLKSSSSGSGSTAYKPKLTAAQVASAISEGLVTPAVKQAFEYYYGTSYDSYYGDDEGGQSGAISSYSQLGATAKGIANGMSHVNSSTRADAIGTQIQSALNAGSITKAEANYLMSMMGY